MSNICLIPATVLLCILLIFLFDPRLLSGFSGDGTGEVGLSEVGSNVVGSKNYVSEPWHIPGGSRFYRVGGKRVPQFQDIIDYRGQTDTKHVSDVLAGYDGNIPIIDDTRDEHGQSQFYKPLELAKTTENFWYDMNRLEDSRRENFGNNRSRPYWNKKDYPIVTTNNINMDGAFPQSGNTLNNMYLDREVLQLWGEFDMLPPVPTTRRQPKGIGQGSVWDEPLAEPLAELKSRTTETHREKS